MRSKLKLKALLGGIRTNLIALDGCFKWRRCFQHSLAEQRALGGLQKITSTQQEEGLELPQTCGGTVDSFCREN